jgi:hypothetical protein
VFLPAPVDVRRSVDARAVADSRTTRDRSLQHSTGDSSRQRRRDLDPVGSVAAHLSTAKAKDGQRLPAKRTALIYATDASGSQDASILHLSEFLTRRGWRLAGVHTDADASVLLSERPGLATALAQLRCGAATVFVIDERTYESLPDCLWLTVAVQLTGGTLCVAADDPAAVSEACAPDMEAVAAFAEVVRPLGLCREDEG